MLPGIGIGGVGRGLGPGSEGEGIPGGLPAGMRKKTVEVFVEE